MNDDSGDGRIVGELAEGIDCARLAAEAELSMAFGNAIVGYGQRSVVFLAEQAVLKVYTHRWQERASREAAGLRVAAHAADLRIPDVLANDELSGQLSWLVCIRLAGQQPSQTENTTPVFGQVAARLHTLPTHQVEDLAAYRRRLRDLPRGTTAMHQAAPSLDSALADAAPAAEQACTYGFVHGDLSSRNILLAAGEVPGVIDFESSGAGCCYDDLGTLVLHETLLGPRDRRLLLDGYDTERRRLDPTATPTDPDHLAYHLVIRARWILQWAIELDPDLADAITGLTPWLLAALNGTEAVW